MHSKYINKVIFILLNLHSRACISNFKEDGRKDVRMKSKLMDGWTDGRKEGELRIVIVYFGKINLFVGPSLSLRAAKSQC